MQDDNTHPIYNISADPEKQNWPLLELQLLIDSGHDLDQLYFKLQMPGFRMNEVQERMLARIIIEVFKHQTQPPHSSDQTSDGFDGETGVHSTDEN